MRPSAADVQKRHELQGTPDPFPALSETSPSDSQSHPSGPSREDLDTSSIVAFPSLVPSASAPTQAAGAEAGTGAASRRPSAWTSGPRMKAMISKSPVFTDSFTLSAIDLSIAGKDGRPATLGEVLKQVMAKYKVKLEASATQKTRLTTFHMRAESQKDLDKAKRSLLGLLSPVVKLILNAPASTIATIIGPKGATLKQIRDQTSVRIDIPRKDSLVPPSANGSGHAHSASSSGRVTPNVPDHDDDDEPTIPITVTGPQPFAFEAQALLKQIIASKTSKTSQRVRDIPEHVLPFVIARRAAFQDAAEGGEVNIIPNVPAREIVVSGDREAVGLVVANVKATVESLKVNLTHLKLPIPKRQQRLLTGNAADEIMEQSKCFVVSANAENASDEVTLWGNPSDLPAGLSAVMQRANSKHIHEFPLPGPIAFTKQLITYLTNISYAKALSSANPGVAVYMPSLVSAEKTHLVSIDIVGEKLAVDAVVRQVSAMLGRLSGAMKEVTVDWLVHRVIAGKYAKKIKQFHDAHNVLVLFPPEAAERSSVLLVYDPSSFSASSSSITEKEKQLEEVSKELLKFAQDADNVKSELLDVDRKLHGAVVGKGRTTLNAIIGEDTTLSIKVGSEAGQPTQDIILVRGASAEVDRAVKEILQIVEKAKNDEIDNGYSVEFEIEREYVGRIVGAQGSGVNKLRDQLGVNIDVSDETDGGEKEPSKKKKTAHLKSRVKIIGRKENVEEAKKRILTQIERLADETSEVLKIPSQYHSSLIGQSGKYAIRLEEKYSVKITFPRHYAENGEGRTREQLKPDEVLVKGGKKGVAGAKAELLDALEFEKESNNVIKFTVPSRSVARILGKGGATINEIKMNTDAQIDVDKPADDTSTVTPITVRGTAEAVKAAKEAILAISDQIGEETTVSVTIDSKYHRSLIGAGGQGLRDLVMRCGGPSDSKLHASLIRFPRHGEPSDEVRLRGDPKLVTKLKAELEKAVVELQDRIVLATEIPATQHRALIGRGGQNLNDLQKRLGVQIQFPGSRSYHQVGEPANASEVADADPASVVKVSGPSKACELALGELKANIKPRASEGPHATVQVPLKYHHIISQQGNFFRNLRSFGVQVDQSVLPTRSAVPSRSSSQTAACTARIDESDESDSIPIQWEITTNFQDAEEGESEWTLKARDQAGLDKALQLVQEALKQAEAMSHVGFLTLPDRSIFPRIVGTRGANVARLRAETGAEITVSRENNTIVITGTEDAILMAKDFIIKVANSSRSQRRPS